MVVYVRFVSMWQAYPSPALPHKPYPMEYPLHSGKVLVVNPLAPLAFYDTYYTEFGYFSTKRVHLNFDILGEMHQWEVNWGQKCIVMGGCQTYVLQGTSRPYIWHPHILASQEQLALGGLNIAKVLEWTNINEWNDGSWCRNIVLSFPLSNRDNGIYITKVELCKLGRCLFIFVTSEIYIMKCMYSIWIHKMVTILIKISRSQPSMGL